MKEEIKIVKGHPICPDCGDEMYLAPQRVSEDDIHDRYVCYGCHNVFYFEVDVDYVKT